MLNWHSGAYPIIFGTTAAERFRIGPLGQLGIGGANYGSAGHVLTSGGATTGPSWAPAPAASNVIFANGSIFSAALTTSATTANQVVDTVAIATYRTVKYTVSVTSGSAYQASEILVIHDGAAATITEYAYVATGSSLASFDADISATDLRLLVTPVNAVTTVKIVRTAINV
jgi:hypothetical protein